MVSFAVVTLWVHRCATILQSSLVPIVLVIKRFVCVYKSITILRVILRARIPYASSWFGIPAWCTYIMHSFDGYLRHGVILRLVVSLASLLHHGDMVDDLENIFHHVPRPLLFYNSLPYMVFSRPQMSNRLSMPYPGISDNLEVWWILSSKTFALTKYLVVDSSFCWHILRVCKHCIWNMGYIRVLFYQVLPKLMPRQAFLLMNSAYIG